MSDDLVDLLEYLEIMRAEAYVKSRRSRSEMRKIALDARALALTEVQMWIEGRLTRRKKAKR